MKRIRFILTAVAMLMLSSSVFAQTPEALLEKVVSKLQKGGLSCDYTLKTTQGNFSGSLKGVGRLFTLSTPGATVWFDGHQMWTANKTTRETTITVPTETEIFQTNPIAMLNGYKSDFKIFYSKNKAPAGCRLILLNPKNKDTGIKAVQVKVNIATSLPTEIVIRMDDNSIATLTIRNLRTGVSFPDGVFRYPEKDYREYTIVDLR